MSFHRRSNHKVARRVIKSRRGKFETLEARLTLSANLAFAGAFDILSGPTSGPGGVYTSSGPNQGRGGGLTTDAAGNRYVTINGAHFTSSFAPFEEDSEIVDLDPGAGVSAQALSAGVVKLAPNGSVLWTIPLAATGPNSPVVRTIAAVDADENVYITGELRGTIDIDPGPGVANITSTAGGADYGMYMAKYNSGGQLQWARTLAANELAPVRVAVDGDGNLIVASNFTAVPTDPPMDVDAGPGQFLVQERGSYDLVVLKYSTDGDFVWSRQFGDAGTDQSGNIPALGVNAQGDVFVSGAFKGTIDLDPGVGVSTVYNGDAATFDRYLAHLDSAGNYVWGYATEGPGQISFRDVAFAADGGILLGGSFTGTTDVQPGAGEVTLTSTGTGANGVIVKLNSDASVAWAKPFGGGGTNVTEIDLDGDGNIYLGGSFGASSLVTADFDPGPGVYELSNPAANETAYAMSLTGDGDFRWAAALGGNTGRSQVEGLRVTPDRAVQLSGSFRGTGDFEPRPDSQWWLSSDGRNPSNQTVFTATLTQVTPDPGAPVVDAGASQSIPALQSTTLHGTVTDDGLPAPVTTTWSLVSGPGAVTFGNASALETTASFTAVGNYVLKLEATDSQFTTADYVHITVNPLTASLTPVADAYIDGKMTTTNFGASTGLTVNGNPDDAALLRFDLSSIPAGSTLQSATFSLNVTGASTRTYEIYELKRNWTESQVTWKKANSATNWQSAGAQGSLDRGSTVLGTITATSTGVCNVVLNAAGVAVVQGWINNPATNFGFVIQDYANTNKDDLVFSSKEAAPANRPQLQLVYAPPAAAPAALMLVQVPVLQGAGTLAPTAAASASAGATSGSRIAANESAAIREAAFATLGDRPSFAPPHRTTLTRLSAAVAPDSATPRNGTDEGGLLLNSAWDRAFEML